MAETSDVEDINENETEADDVETITVKLPSGQKMLMISPFDDNGDVPWLVPKNERDLGYFEIAWNTTVDDEYRNKMRDQLIVLRRRKLKSPWIFENTDRGFPNPDFIYKSRFDGFNGKYIIDRILRNKKADGGVKTEKSGLEQTDELSAPLKKSSQIPSPKRSVPRWTDSNRNQLAELIERLESFSEAEMKNPAHTWLKSQIKKREKYLLNKKRANDIQNNPALSSTIDDEFSEEEADYLPGDSALSSEHVLSELQPESFYRDTANFDAKNARKLFNEIRNRERYEKRKRKKRFRQRVEKLTKKLADRFEQEWERITPKYLKALRNLRVRSVKRFIFDWQPKIILPAPSKGAEENEPSYTSALPDLSYLDSIHNTSSLPFVTMTSFEANSKFPFWVEEQKTAADTVMLNMYIRETALSRGWVNSPYYQLCTASGLLLDGSKRNETSKRKIFLKSANYELKAAAFERLLYEGTFSEEKMQEMIALGVADQDPFVKDVLDFLNDKRQWQLTMGEEIEQHLEENPGLYNYALPSGGVSVKGELNEEETDIASEKDEEDEELNRKEKIKYLVGHLLYEMYFNRDPRLTRWDAQTTHDETVRRELIMKQLMGDLKADMSDDQLKTLFGQYLFGTIWIHPDNFRRTLERSDMTTVAEMKEKRAEFDEFLANWKKEWSQLKKSTIKRDVKTFFRRKYVKNHEQRKILLRAFRGKLKKYRASGYVPQLFLKAFVGRKKEKDSRLNFLQNRLDAFEKHLEIDRRELNKFVVFLRDVLKASSEGSDDKAGTTKMSYLEEEEMEEEEEEEARGKKKVKLQEEKQEEKKKLTLLYSQTKVGGQLESSNLGKVPLLIDSELKGMNEEKVKALYEQHQVPVKRPANATNLLLQWYSEDIGTYDDFLPEYYLRNGVFKDEHLLTLSRYLDLLNVTQIAEVDDKVAPGIPDSFICHSSKKFKVPICVDVKHLSSEDFEPRLSGQNEGKTIQAEGLSDSSPTFSSALLNVWRSRIVRPSIDSGQPPIAETLKLDNAVSITVANKENHRKTMKSMEGISMGKSGISSEFNDELNTTYLSEEELTGESEMDLTKYELKFDDFVKPRPKETVAKQLGLYNSPTDRKISSHKSFFDVDRFFQNQDTMKLWKMAASGKLCKKVKSLERNRNNIRKASTNLWSWDSLGEEINSEEIKYHELIAKYIAKHIFRKKEYSDGETKKWKENMFEEFKPSLTYDDPTSAIELKENYNNVPNFTIFSSTCPLKRELLSNNSKVEDRKLFRVLESCGTLIFDVTRSRQDMYQCSWYLRKLFLKMEKLDKEEEMKSNVDISRNKDKGIVIARNYENRAAKPSNFRPTQRIILLTNFLSWADSPENVKGKLSENNFYERKPHADYLDYYIFENMLYRIGRRQQFNIRTTIIYTGLPYGFEEEGLSYIFKMAYENKREIPIYGPGTNNPPMVHIEELSEIVAGVMQNPSPPLMVFAVQDIDLTLEKRVFNVSAQIGYPHVRTTPGLAHEWNNAFPKIIHDTLQLNVTAADVDNSPVLNKPRLPDPFSTGEDGYKLIKEFKDSRGLAAKTVLLLGAPTQMKLDLAKAISVFYNLPLITRRNIHSECVKVVQLLGEMKSIRKNYEQNVEEEVEKEEALPKRPEFSLEEMKQVIENQNCDVNRNWLLVCLRYLLRTIRYKKIGYVLCDVPMSESDAVFLFNNPLRRAEPRRFQDVSAYVTSPAKVIFIEADCDIIHDCCVQSKDNVIEDDWNDFWDNYYAGTDAAKYFTKRLKKVHRVNMKDEFFFERIVEIIGPPCQPDGVPMFDDLLSLLNDIRLKRAENRKGIERASRFFDTMQRKGLDLAPGLTHQPLPVFKKLSTLDYKDLRRPYYFCTSLPANKKRVTRSKAGPYREVRRKWAKKSGVFHQMPTEENRAVWKMARKFWAPQEKTKEYILQFQAENM